MTAIDAVGLDVSQAAMATLALILVITLCFLPRPSRATLLWVFAFTTSMVCLYANSVAVAAQNESVRRGALGAGLCAVALIWSGLRSWRGRPPLVWVAVLDGIVSAAALATVPDAVYGLAIRTAFFAAAVFAALGVWELRHVAERRLPAVFAFQVGSGIFTALGTAALVAGIAAPQTIDDLTVLRGVSGVIVLTYGTCAVVGMAAMTQRASSAPRAPVDRFARIARDRMRRAQQRGERDWALIVVQLDDLAELRAVHGPGDYRRLVEAFERAVVRSLPAGADVGVVSAGTMMVLIDRPENVIRDHMRTLLDAVEEAPASEHVVGLSASVGWVPAVLADYDFDALRSRAAAAAEHAAAEGGDRWHRVRAAS